MKQLIIDVQISSFSVSIERSYQTLLHLLFQIFNTNKIEALMAQKWSTILDLRIYSQNLLLQVLILLQILMLPVVLQPIDVLEVILECTFSTCPYYTPRMPTEVDNLLKSISLYQPFAQIRQSQFHQLPRNQIIQTS